MKKIFAAILVTLAMTGTAIAGSNYKLSLDAPKTAKVSTKSQAKVKVEPTEGYKMNLEFPTKLTLTAPDGVTLEKTKIAAGDVRIDKKAAEFDIVFTATSPGKKAFTGEVKFAVCTDKDCLPQVEKVAFEVEVK